MGARRPGGVEVEERLGGVSTGTGFAPWNWGSVIMASGSPLEMWPLLG